MLELKNLYKTFNPGTINEKLALNGLSLTLKEGDFVTVIGGNGAGKSTMLNAVAGTWMVDEGQRQALTLLMATLKKPKLLLLDEHTAALDPKTAAKVLEITDMIVNRDHLTTMMITHNMQDAINHGNRLIMMMEGKIILDIEGEEKKKLTVRNLLDQFEKASGQEFSNDSALLS